MHRRDALRLLITATGGALLPGARLAEAEGGAPRYAVKPAFAWLGTGEVKPAGWLKEQMRRDLQVGFAGRLDDLCPEAASDIFANGRNTLTHGNAAESGGRVEMEKWWNGETVGNWRAGFIMLSYLSGDETNMRKADQWVHRMLASQDEDGYLGINGKDLRFRYEGELWTQACLLRGLLAYAELTGNDSALVAVRRAVDLSIASYRGGTGTNSYIDSHDLMIADVLERLFDLTGDVKYPDFALWLYEKWDWSKTRSGQDCSLASLSNRDLPLMGHGVHAVENVRVPLWLWMVTGREDLGIAARNALDKLERYTLPGGSVVSSEHIENQAPDPNKAEFEYCVTKETQATYGSALQKMGLSAHAERVERVFFNDAQASRLPDGSAITYLTSDNRGAVNGRSPDGLKGDPANKFSPTHRDVAVCCNPNAANVAPLYVRGMWMRHRDGGLAALLYGPCTVATTVGGIRVELEERTDYPFAHTVEIVVRPEREKDFPLYFRDPQWSRGTKLTCDGARIERDGAFWKVSKRWKPGDRVSLEFVAEVRQVAAVNGELALQYGALLYALLIPHKRTVVKTYPLGFEDAYYEPESGAVDEYVYGSEMRWKDFGFEPAVKPRGTAMLRPFDEPVVTLRGELVHRATGAKSSVELVPLGSAPVLRRLTFPVSP